MINSNEKKLYVTLIAHTPLPENLIATGARLCYSNATIDALNESVSETDQTKYLKKLMDLGHLSPTEHASFTFGVEGVSRTLLAQLTRHRIASFSVQSQRYVNQEMFGYIIPPSIEALGDEAVSEYCSQMQQMQGWYDTWLEKLGGRKEDARFVLPNAAETRLILTMNVRELLHFFELRACNRAQWEICALAWAMLGHCMRVAPTLFDGAGASCIRGNCSEGKMSCGQSERVRKRVNSLQEFLEKSSELNEEQFSREICKWVQETRA